MREREEEGEPRDSEPKIAGALGRSPAPPGLKERIGAALDAVDEEDWSIDGAGHPRRRPLGDPFLLLALAASIAVAVLAPLLIQGLRPRPRPPLAAHTTLRKTLPSAPGASGSEGPSIRQSPASTSGATLP